MPIVPAILLILALLVGVPALIVWVVTRNWPPAKEDI